MATLDVEEGEAEVRHDSSPESATRRRSVAPPDLCCESSARKRISVPDATSAVQWNSGVSDVVNVKDSPEGIRPCNLC